MHYLQRELYDLIKADDAIFDFLQTSSLDGLWYWDLEKPDHEWMSERFWRLFGVDPATKDHLASEWQDLILPEDLELVVMRCLSKSPEDRFSSAADLAAALDDCVLGDEWDSQKAAHWWNGQLRREQQVAEPVS